MILPEYKLIVAGGRDFDNAELMSRVLYAMSDVEFADKSISIVSGMAKGADALAYMFAHKLDIKCYEFHARWRHPNGSVNTRAGFIRNEEMGQFADGLLAFHDGKSVGTAGMIRYMRSLGKPVTVINY